MERYNLVSKIKGKIEFKGKIVKRKLEIQQNDCNKRVKLPVITNPLLTQLEQALAANDVTTANSLLRALCKQKLQDQELQRLSSWVSKYENEHNTRLLFHPIILLKYTLEDSKIMLMVNTLLKKLYAANLEPYEVIELRDLTVDVLNRYDTERQFHKKLYRKKNTGEGITSENFLQKLAHFYTEHYVVFGVSCSQNPEKYLNREQKLLLLKIFFKNLSTDRNTFIDIFGRKMEGDAVQATVQESSNNKTCFPLALSEFYTYKAIVETNRTAMKMAFYCAFFLDEKYLGEKKFTGKKLTFFEKSIRGKYYNVPFAGFLVCRAILEKNYEAYRCYVYSMNQPSYKNKKAVSFVQDIEAIITHDRVVNNLGFRNKNYLIIETFININNLRKKFPVPIIGLIDNYIADVNIPLWRAVQEVLTFAELGDKNLTKNCLFLYYAGINTNKKFIENSKLDKHRQSNTWKKLAEFKNFEANSTDKAAISKKALETVNDLKVEIHNDGGSTSGRAPLQYFYGAKYLKRSILPLADI